MQESWTRELLRLATLLVFCAVLGSLLDHTLVFMVLGMAVYLAWHLYWLFRLEHWLVRDRRALPPESGGIWGDIFYQLYRHYRKNRRRKQRIARLIRAFRDSTAAMPDGAVILNKSWQIVWFNDAAEDLLGLVAAQDVGQRIANLVRNPAFIRYLGREDFAEPLEIPAPDDENRHLTMQVSPYGDGQRLLLVRDTTRMHRLEEMRREFVANASHELRSPLTVITGYLEVLADDPKLAQDWAGPIGEMRRQSARMSGIIEDLLELSRLETATEQPNGVEIDVHGVLARIREEAIAMSSGPRDLDLLVETDARLRGAEKEIYSAFSNLVFNAMRYTPESGKVTVRWSLVEGEARLDVEDTGIGIAAEHIPRLTERFYRVDQGRVRKKGGTGLGLAIVKHVLQRHGARLEIVSTPGKGSRFTCIFPTQRVVSIAA